LLIEPINKNLIQYNTGYLAGKGQQGFCNRFDTKRAANNRRPFAYAEKIIQILTAALAFRLIASNGPVWTFLTVLVSWAQRDFPVNSGHHRFDRDRSSI